MPALLGWVLSLAGCGDSSTGPILDTSAPIPVSDLAITATTANSFTLRWTAPGDNGTTGTASTYDVRYSTSAITSANFATATPATNVPTPAVAGTTQSMTIGGLASSTTYYFALRASDEVPNVSGPSNIVSGTTLAPAPDTTPPAPITDVTAAIATESSIGLEWTATGDDGQEGTAASYDLRFSTSPITPANFDASAPVSGEPVPSAAGTSESMTVDGLSTSTTYYFAVRVSDEVPNGSDLSNVAMGTTLAPPPDTTPPAPITDLTTATATESAIGLEWTATGDDGQVGTAASYDLRYSTSPITPANFNASTPVLGEPVPSAAGASESMTIDMLSAGTTYYFALRASDEVPNVSDLSNVAMGITSAAGPISFSTPDLFTTGSGPRSVAVGDVNSDGKPDLVTANFFGGTVSVLLGTGTGTFSPKNDYSLPYSDYFAGAYPDFATIGDLKSDGIADIAATHFYENKVSLLFGNGSGTFGSVTELTSGGTAYSLAIGDFQRDGVPDIVATDNTNNRVSLFMGYSTGAFYQPPWSYDTGLEPASVVVAPLDGDEFLDVVTANLSSNSISVLINNGDLTFRTRSDYGTGATPWCVAAADLNHDGIQDLVTANSASSSVSVLSGSGTGTFGTKTDFATAAGPRWVAIGDLDGDGNPDLVTANYFSGSISVLRGNGDGSFEGRTDIPSARWANCVAITDLNGDGKPDLAVANYGASSVSVFLNTSGGSPEGRIVPPPR